MGHGELVFLQRVGALRMLSAGQYVNVQIWGRIKTGVVVDVGNGEAVIDFPASGGLLRMVVPASWCTTFIPKGGKIT